MKRENDLNFVCPILGQTVYLKFLALDLMDMILWCTKSRIVKKSFWRALSYFKCIRILFRNSLFNPYLYVDCRLHIIYIQIEYRLHFPQLGSKTWGEKIIIGLKSCKGSAIYFIGRAWCMCLSHKIGKCVGKMKSEAINQLDWHKQQFMVS